MRAIAWVLGVVVFAWFGAAASAQQLLTANEAKTLPAGAAEADVTPPVDSLSLPARVQSIVDAVRLKLAIPQEVVVSVVPEDKLLVSVERLQDRDNVFSLAFERDFLGTLSEEEITAVVAHELGHVWIFTHHPFLQTEELANKVALQLVTRTILDKVYEKVWQRTGAKGDLTYLPTR